MIHKKLVSIVMSDEFTSNPNPALGDNDLPAGLESGDDDVIATQPQPGSIKITGVRPAQVPMHDERHVCLDVMKELGIEFSKCICGSALYCTGASITGSTWLALSLIQCTGQLVKEQACGKSAPNYHDDGDICGLLAWTKAFTWKAALLLCCADKRSFCDVSPIESNPDEVYAGNVRFHNKQLRSDIKRHNEAVKGGDSDPFQANQNASEIKKAWGSMVEAAEEADVPVRSETLLTYNH